jgi:hypothetical protein
MHENPRKMRRLHHDASGAGHSLAAGEAGRLLPMMIMIGMTTMMPARQ